MQKIESVEPEPVAPESLPANSLSPVEDVPAEKLPDTPQPVIENDGVPERVEKASKQLSPSLAPSRQAGVKRRMRGPAQSSASTPWPAPVTHVSVKEPSVPAPKPNGHDEMSSVSTFANDDAIPGHENRAQEDEKTHEQAGEEEIAIDDLPTRALTVPTEDALEQAEDVPVEDLPTRSIPVLAEKPPRVQEQRVEKVSSNPFLAVPATQSEAQKQTVEDRRMRAQSAPSVPENFPVPTALQAQASPHVVSSDYQVDRVVTPPPARRSRRRWPIIIVALLIILILGGAGTLGAMMVLSQQSSNDPVIQAQVGFSDPQLGLSLLYPNGWQKQIDTGKSTAHFYASSHIGQVDIMVATSSGTVKQALQQQATKMGMSGTKTGATLTFAGASWEQLQGTMQQSGASYTDAIVATVHGNQLYMIVQQAPQNNYADWEKEFFAPLRSSFKFL
ncbi:MAG: hypothetical protein H0V70_03725 [Ktedonobacteraceae bacterium]|nr:hypothetical protein [Ktedonobacteraceae bacterium]